MRKWNVRVTQTVLQEAFVIVKAKTLADAEIVVENKLDNGSRIGPWRTIGEVDDYSEK